MKPPHVMYHGPDKQDRLMQLASLFEGEFSIDWLVATSEVKVSGILQALEKAAQQSWLKKTGPGSFFFTDIKKRSQLRQSLDPVDKQNLHRRIAQILVADLPDNAGKAEALSGHLLQVANNVEGCRWLVRAGNLFRHSFQPQKALACYSKALNDLEALPDREADHFFSQAAIQYSKVSTAKHDTRKVRAILVQAMERSLRLGDRASQAVLHMHLAKTEWLLSRYSSALKHFETGWSLAKTIEDPWVQRSAHTFSTFFLYWQGRFQEAVESYQKTVSDVETIPSERFNLYAALTVGVCYSLVGQVTHGVGMMNAIRAQCQERGDHYLAVQAQCAIGAAMLDIHRLDEAIDYLEKAILTNRHRHQNQWMVVMGHLMLAYAYHLEKQDQKALRFLKIFLRRSREVQVTVRPYPYLLAFCWDIEQGLLPPIAGLALEREIHRSIRSRNVFIKGIAYRYQALLGKRRGHNPQKILHALRQSLKWLAESGCQLELARSQLEFAHHWLDQGNQERADREIETASRVLSNLNQDLIPSELRGLSKGQFSGKKLLREILQLGQEVVTLREHKDLVQHIFSAVNRITGAERGAIFVWDPSADQPRLKLRASKNLTPDQIEGPGFAQAMEMISQVASDGKGCVRGRHPASRGPKASSPVIQSCICVPMILRGKVVGVLYHDNRLLRSAFKESDQELLSYFAGQAAIALDNAQAYQEISRLNQQINQEKLYYEEENLQHLHFGEFVGESPGIKKVLAQVNQVANTNANVLILGETGVGKELVARAIHRHSERQQKPFVRVLCNALPDSLIASELFGHERGAFTGATSRRIGRFELADGGTLFLDEIGELPPEVQVRLLRVLQTKEFERVGGAKTLSSDFRLVTATNRDLEKEVKIGRLRMDLYYRLNVFPIWVPPLRERKEDITLLAHFFLKSYATKMGKKFARIPQVEIDRLMQYDWPGNVRELENVIERAVILNSGPVFRVKEQIESAPSATGPGPAQTLKDAERRHILWALEHTGWKVRGEGGCAQLLEVHPSTLAYRMKKLGIVRPPGKKRSRGTLGDRHKDGRGLDLARGV